MAGYVYVFSNESMPGILKIGMTEVTPDNRLKEANRSDTWRPPTPYKFEFSKYVPNALKSEKFLHEILKEYRINPNREFFRISLEELNTIIGTINGKKWIHICKKDKNNDEEEEKIKNKRLDNLRKARDQLKLRKGPYQLNFCEIPEEQETLFPEYYEFKDLSKSVTLNELKKYTLDTIATCYFRGLREVREYRFWKEFCEYELKLENEEDIKVKTNKLMSNSIPFKNKIYTEPQ